MFCRLDYRLISNTLHDLVIKTNITHAIRSDHSAITLRLKTETVREKGPGYWKLNISLLEKDQFVEEMRNKLTFWFKEAEEHYNDERMQLEWIKFKIRTFSIEYSKKSKKERNKELQHVQEKLERAKETFEQNPSQENQNNLNLLENELDRMIEYRVKGIITRARVQKIAKDQKIVILEKG